METTNGARHKVKDTEIFHKISFSARYKLYMTLSYRIKYMNTTDT